MTIIWLIYLCFLKIGHLYHYQSIMRYNICNFELSDFVLRGAPFFVFYVFNLCMVVQSRNAIEIKLHEY